MAIINCPECKKQISDKTDKCPNCGFPVYMMTNMSIAKIKCTYCGCMNDSYKDSCTSCGATLEKPDNMISHQEQPKQETIVNNIYLSSPVHTHTGKPKNKWTSFLLCFFLGFLGVHKFYEGKIGMGILYVFTMGLFGIGWLVDIILILTKPNPYYV